MIRQVQQLKDERAAAPELSADTGAKSHKLNEIDQVVIGTNIIKYGATLPKSSLLVSSTQESRK